MAKLSSFTRNAVAMREGEWINPGAEYGGLEIKSKAMGAAYSDMRAGEIRRLARRPGGEAKIGAEERNVIDIEALNKTCLLDIRGLEHDDGSPVTIAEFKKMILKPEYQELAVIAFQCAGQVGQTNAALIEEAEGNLSNASPSTSSGPITPTS